ncbi:Mitogen-activated protein kinase kinase kinase mlk-1, partial [Tulasnella sp. 417]
MGGERKPEGVPSFDGVRDPRASVTDFGSARAIEETDALQVNKPTNDGQPPKPDLGLAPESPKIELGDCGTSITVTGPAWTLRWAAPELLNDEAPDLASDVWAFAWICWEVMTGNFPFYGENESAVSVRLATGNLPGVGDNQQLSQLQALCSLMTDCWSLDPDRRPTISLCAEYIRRWMDWAIPSPRTPEALPDTQSVELLLALGRVDLSNGKLNEAIRRFQRAVDIARSTMQDWKRSCAAYDLAHAYVLSSDYAKAEASYIEAREAISGTYRWDKHQLGHILSGLGDVYSLSGKIAKAETAYIEAREAFAAIGEQECSGHNTIQLGMLYRRTNECDKAEALCKEARDMYVRIQSVRGVPHATLALGHVYLRRGDYREAQASYTEAYDVFTRTGDNPCLISSAMGLGHVYRLCEEYDKAEAMYNKAHTPLVRLRNKRFIGIMLLGMAEIREKQQRFTEAEQYLEDANAIFSELGWEDDLSECDAQIKSLHGRIKSLAERVEVRDPECEILSKDGAVGPGAGQTFDKHSVRDILQSLNTWRIGRDQIEFSDAGRCKTGATADVELAILHPSSISDSAGLGNFQYVAVKKFRLEEASDYQRALL